MSKIVFFCIPAHGHTNPTLRVVEELVKRGHQVWYYSYNMMKEKIEATGATFVSCDNYDTQLHLSPEDAARIGSDLVLSTEVLVDTTLALDDAVCLEMEKLRPDCIVADSMAVWGKAVALKLGIPFVSSTTTFAFNKHSARIMKQSPKQLISMVFSMPRINKHIRRLQDKGYPVNNILDIIQNDENTHTIVYTSPEFQPCAETFSDRYAFVGPSVRLTENVVEKTGKKLVYISMGTVNNNMIRMYRNCIAALGNTDYQVIMSIGTMAKKEQLGEIPDNIAIFEYVDQIAVLKSADIFISHCGMNSVSESLYFGVPLMMVPQTSEQGGVAARTEMLGAGIIIKDTGADAIRQAVDRLASEESFRNNAKAIGDSFRKCSGPAGAAEKILSLCTSHEKN